MNKLMHSKLIKIGLIVLLFIVMAFHFTKFDLIDRVDSKIETKENSFINENILFAENSPTDDKNVFFIETGELTNDVKIKARQACAIESAAMTNPHLKVFVLYSSIERFKALQVTQHIEAILSYPNVFINYLNMEQFSVGTPLKDFINSGKLSKSLYRMEHTSDVLRYLVLWKFGGTYLDSDMIVRKRLDATSNYACRQSEDEINGAILNLDSKVGRTLAGILIDNLVENFSGESFVRNGPQLLTRVAKNLCKTNSMDEIIKKKTCNGFNYFNSSSCYEIKYNEWSKLMEAKYSDEVMQRVNDSIVVHFWNHVTKTVQLSVSSPAAYIKLAKQFCPKVIDASVEIF